LSARGTLPVAVRAQLQYASAGAADPDASGGPLPKTVVDEVEVLTGGSLGKRESYWIEQYLIDGGEVGRTRDAWFAYRATSDTVASPVVLRAGQFTLPLPLDPETFRETTQPYAIWSQQAGSNPFTFFDPKIGVQGLYGDPARQISGSASLLQGHDPQSGVPSHGLDTMFTLERDFGDVRLTTYRYGGSRVLNGPAFGNNVNVSGVLDRFWRQGYGVGWSHGGTEVDAVYQSGNDGAADLYGDALQTSGGFVQVRRALGDRAFAIGRYDATQDAAFGRSLTAGLGYRFTKNTRLTVFETAERDFTGRPLRVLSSSLLTAW
jgi:hypothetical protein